MALGVLTACGVMSASRDEQTIKGAGVSDHPLLAEWLGSWLEYTNFHYGREPHLDVTQPPPELEGTFGVITCSDVLEHVLPPVSTAFAGLFRLLSPGGTLVLSVPCGIEGGVEHFPDLHDWEVDRTQPEPVLVNRRADGHVETFRNLVWHGGEGWTLEMRRFDRSWLRRELADAGFTDLIELRRDWPGWGIAFEDWSRVWIARRPAETNGGDG